MKKQLIIALAFLGMPFFSKAQDTLKVEETVVDTSIVIEEMAEVALDTVPLDSLDTWIDSTGVGQMPDFGDIFKPKRRASFLYMKSYLNYTDFTSANAALAKNNYPTLNQPSMQLSYGIRTTMNNRFFNDIEYTQFNEKHIADKSGEKSTSFRTTGWGFHYGYNLLRNKVVSLHPIVGFEWRKQRMRLQEDSYFEQPFDSLVASRPQTIELKARNWFVRGGVGLELNLKGFRFGAEAGYLQNLTDNDFKFGDFPIKMGNIRTSGLYLGATVGIEIAKKSKLPIPKGMFPKI